MIFARFGSGQFIVLAFTLLCAGDGWLRYSGDCLRRTGTYRSRGIARSSLGPVLAAALLGMAVGAAGIGHLGDRHGRKTALIVSCALMVKGSLASTLAGEAIELATFRFITGIGLGGALPNATALMFE